MNKSEFIMAVAEELKCTKVEATKMIDAMLRVKNKALSRGEELRLIGFGTFKVANVQAKEVRNPQNGQKIKVPATKRVKFAAGKHLKTNVHTGIYKEESKAKAKSSKPTAKTPAKTGSKPAKR